MTPKESAAIRFMKTHTPEDVIRIAKELKEKYKNVFKELDKK